MKDYWTTAKGEQIPYTELSDDHLRNIIKDGYRNPKIFEEAERRGFTVPDRAVDKMMMKDPTQIFMYLESFASCAIEGNELGERLMKLWQEDKPLFWLEFNAFLERVEPKEKKKKFRPDMIVIDDIEHGEDPNCKRCGTDISNRQLRKDGITLCHECEDRLEVLIKDLEHLEFTGQEIHMELPEVQVNAEAIKKLVDDIKLDWKDLVSTNGELDEEKVMNELHDFEFLMKQATLVYEEIAGLSKTNYTADVIISEHNKRCLNKAITQDDVRAMIKDSGDIGELKGALKDYFEL